MSEGREELQVFLVYRSPNSPEAQTEKLAELVGEIRGRALLIEDFNFPSINWEEETATG